MDILNIIKARRSIRKFTSEVPEDKDIESILEAGRWAPSGLNNQPWKFVIVKEEKKNGLAGFTKYSRIITEAPLAVIVCLDLKGSYNRDKDIMAIGACIENMLIQIHSLGLGACWLGEILKKKEEVAKFLELDKNLEIMAVIPMGYPAENPSHTSRKEFKDIVFHL